MTAAHRRLGQHAELRCTPCCLSHPSRRTLCVARLCVGAVVRCMYSDPGTPTARGAARARRPILRRPPRQPAVSGLDLPASLGSAATLARIAARACSHAKHTQPEYMPRSRSCWLVPVRVVSFVLCVRFSLRFDRFLRFKLQNPMGRCSDCSGPISCACTLASCSSATHRRNGRSSSLRRRRRRLNTGLHGFITVSHRVVTT